LWFEGKGDLGRTKVMELVGLGGGVLSTTTAGGMEDVPRPGQGRAVHVAIHDYNPKTQKAEVRGRNAAINGCESAIYTSGSAGQLYIVRTAIYTSGSAGQRVVCCLPSGAAAFCFERNATTL
jgi:hypothetical protein